MNRYNIRIDGEVMPNSFTYEELLLNDILDFDDIDVKQVSKSNWTNIKSFYFPEEHDDPQPSDEAYYVGEDGQVHFKKHKDETTNQSHREYSIDEFGQVVSQNNIGGGSNSASTSTSRNSSSASSSSSSSTTSSGDNTGWKIFFTIVAIIIFIVITCTTGWGSIPAGIIGYWTLKTIWGDDL